MAALSFDDMVPPADAAPPPDVPSNTNEPVIVGLENSAAAAAAYNKAHPGAGVTADTVISPAGAIGAHQVMPSTAKLYGFDPSRLYDPAYNQIVSDAVLNDLQDKFGNDPEAVAIGYNAGPARAQAWLKAGRNDKVLPSETQGYLKRLRASETAPAPTTPQAAPTFDDLIPGNKSGMPVFDDLVPKAPDTKPEASWSKVLSPDFASAWDRLKNAGLGVAQWAYNQDPTQDHFLGVPIPGTGGNVPPALQKQLDAYKAPVNQWLNKARADVATDIKANAPELNPGSLKSYTYQTLTGVTDMLPAIAAAVVTKNPAVAAAIMGVQAGGERYTQALQEGRTPAQASMDAQFDAMVNGGLGLLPMHALMAPGGSFLKKALTNAGAFGVQSVATEALQIGYDKGIIGKDMTLQQAWERLEQAGIVGTLTGAFLGGGHAAMELAAARFHANTPQKPQERAEPGTAPQAEPAAAAPGAPRGAPTPAELMASVGLGKAGVAPPPEDPWAPVTATPRPEPPAIVSRETSGEEPGYRISAAGIRAEHEAEVSRLAAEGAQAAQRRLTPAPLPSAEGPSLPAPQAASVASEGIPRRELEADTAVTSTGREVPVRYAVVEAAHLVPSQTQEGHPNPNFPADLQPRDRTRAVSQAQIASIAQNINPRLLDRSPNASDGAPIVAPSGVVESGNGRSLALQRAYAEGLPSADAYRDYLAQQGYPVEGMTAPVLVRVRDGEMAPADRQAFVREANQSGQLGYSATERAMADAAAIPDSSLDLYRGGDVESAANRDFVRSFMRAAVPANEHAGMIDQHGGLSQDAVRRVRGALLAKAYADPDLVGSIVESQDSNTKAIGGALTDAAADWAKMRGMAANGEISPALDQTSKLLDAVKLVAHARQTGRNVAEFVSQPDIFSGEAIDPDVEAWLRLMFRNTKDWTQPVGREKLADALQFYAREAQKAQVGQNLLGEAPVAPGQVLQIAKAKQYGERNPETGPSLSFGQGVRPFGRRGAGAGIESPAPGGGEGFAESRAQSARSHLTPAAHVIEGKYGPRPYDADLSEPNPGTAKDLGGELDKFVKDSGVDANTQPDRALQAVANYVYMRGHKFGFESFGMRGADGRLYATTDGQKSSVMFKGRTLQAMNDPSQRLVTFHNHPSSLGFSAGDTASLAYPGHDAMVVVTHDGNFHTYRRKATIKGDDLEKAASELARLHQEAFRITAGWMDPLFRNREVNEDDANFMSSQMVHGILERAGIVDYMGSREAPAYLADRMAAVIADGADQVKRSARYGGIIEPGPAPDSYRLPRTVQFGEAMAELLGGAGENAGQPGGAGREAESAPAPQKPAYKKPEQLQLLEGQLREDEKRPAFKAWFGESKVVDEKGEPLVVYHGTPSGRAIGAFKTPAYFTESPSFAEMFAQERGEKRGAIYPAFLKIEHPYVIDATKEGRHFMWDAEDVARMKAEGYDGVIVKGGEDESDIYTPFDATQIKSSIGNRGTFNPNDPNILREDERRYENEQERTRPPFYSALTHAIGDVKLTRAPAKDWSGLIDNLRTKGVKQEEIDWSGVKDWLAGQTGPVTKDQVLQHLRENEVQVTETKLGAPRPGTISREAQERVAQALYGKPFDSLREFEKDLVENEIAPEKPTKYGEYTLHGGENYRELLLTLPNKKGPLPHGWHVRRVEGEPYEDNTHEVVDEGGEQRGMGNSEADAIRDATTAFKTMPSFEEWLRQNPGYLADEKGMEAYDAHRAFIINGRKEMPEFRSSHFDEPNILAHVRFDDRTGPNGEKILHMAEVQSDWHQQGRRQGYADQASVERAQRARDAANEAARQHRAAQKSLTDYKTDPAKSRIDNANARAALAKTAREADLKWLQADQELREAENKKIGGVPNAPFKSSWHELALKRMLRYAAEHGYDKLSWDTGDTSAERYDLSKQIKQIDFQRVGDDRYDVEADDHQGKRVLQEKNIPIARVEEIAGKDVAKKVEEQGVGPDNYRRWGQLSGLDLKVGGEGMRGFYDKILPAAANKLGKKFGAKVESGALKAAGPENRDFYGVEQNRSGDYEVRRLDDDTVVSTHTLPGLANREARRLNFAERDKATVPTHSIPITDSMRESVMQGQAMFEDKKRYGTPRAVDFEQFAAERGASRQGYGDAGLHRGSKNQSQASKDRNIKAQLTKDDALMQRRADLQKEYDAAVQRGEVRPRTSVERLIDNARGDPDKESTQAAQRVLEKRGVDWRQGAEPEFPKNPATGKDVNHEPVATALKIVQALGRAGDTESLRDAVDFHTDPNVTGIAKADQSSVAAQYARDWLDHLEKSNTFATEPGAVDAHGKALPQTIIPGAEQSAAQLAKAREAAGHGLKVTKAKQKEPGGLFGGGENSDLGQGSLFEDEKRYGELPASDRDQLERAARTGNWIGKFGSNGTTPMEKIRSAIEGAYESWRDNPSVVPPAIGAIFQKTGGLPGGFSDVPTTRPGDTFTENVKRRAAGAMDIVRDVQMLLAPMSQGSKEARAVVKDFANLGRLARYHGQRMMEGLKKNFDHVQLRKMWEAADEESVARQKGEPTAGIGLAKLTPEERRAVQEQQTDAQNVWNAAKDVGIVKGEGLPSYVPRMMVEVASTGVQGLGHGEGARSIPGMGRNLRTSTPQTKHRKYLTTEETEAAGSTKFGTTANVVKDIRTLPLATMRLREAVAGRALINQIKEIGAKTGEETVVEGHEPAGTPYKWFTLDHPSFKTWRPKFVTDPETGKIVAQKDQNGETVFEKVPIFVRDDFEGPLRAALSQDTGKAYNGLMNLKGRAMQAIMYSPLIHNAVEWGRALPAMPGKVASLKIYFEGNAAKRDPEVMTQAIMHGLVPIGHNFGIQDVTSMADPDSIKAGRSWTAKIVGAVPGLFSREAQQAVYRTIDRMGDVWHNTLLWDRVGDLQMGIYANMRDSLIRKGYTPDAAQYTAAHFANRYAGALPLEAMSSMARKIANLTLFSRTYTLGNLGAMKDVVTGLPLDVQAQIERSAGEAGLDKVKSMARRKALTILATDIALFYAGNSILNSALSYITGRQDISQIELGYAKRLAALLAKGTQNPLALLNPFQDLQDLSATSENEPGKENRVFVGYDHNGTAIYARNPTGKIGEEFVNWLTQPITTLKQKLGTFARPTYEALTNDAGFGRHVYDPNAHGIGAVAKDIGRIVELYMGAQVPLDSLKSGANILMGNDKQNKEIDVYKTLGPLAGVTFSKGAPGGPAVGAMYALREAHDSAVQEAMPDIQEKIRNGDILGARKDMRDLKIPPGLQNYYIRAARNPKIRLNTKSARELMRNASPEDRARINELRKANQP